MSQYPGITPEACEQAFRIGVAALGEAAHADVANKFAGTFVVVNPFRIPSSTDPFHVRLDEVRRSVLFMQRVDEGHQDAVKYDNIALTKVRDLWVLRSLLGPNFSGRDIQQNYPQLYRSGMTKWHGGFCRAGIPFAFSGVQGHFDEAFSLTVAVWLEAMSRQAMVDVMESEGAFIV